jgi:hypothetical protein
VRECNLVEKSENRLKYYLIRFFTGRFFYIRFFTGRSFLHPDFNRAKIPSRGDEPDEIDESSPNRQIICNNRLGPILIGY